MMTLPYLAGRRHCSCHDLWIWIWELGLFFEHYEFVGVVCSNDCWFHSLTFCVIFLWEAKGTPIGMRCLKNVSHVRVWKWKCEPRCKWRLVLSNNDLPWIVFTIVSELLRRKCHFSFRKCDRTLLWYDVIKKTMRSVSVWIVFYGNCYNLLW